MDMSPEELIQRLVAIAETDIDPAFNDGELPGSWLSEYPRLSDRQVNCFEMMLLEVKTFCEQASCGHDQCKVKAFNELAAELQLIPMSAVLAMIREIVMRRTMDSWKDGYGPDTIDGIGDFK